MPHDAASRPRDFRILVVGAGIGGLTLAVALQRRGIPVQVVERAATLEPVGAGIAIGPNAMPLLHRLGVGERVAAAGHVLNETHVADARGNVLLRFDFGRIGWRVGGETVALHRSDLQEALLAPVRGLVRTDAAVVGIELRGERFGVTFSSGEQAEYDLVVGADGISSTVRRLVFGGPAPRYAGYTSWRFVVPQPCRLPDSLEMWHGDRRLGLVPLGGGRLYGFLVMNAPAGWPDPPEGRLARLKAAFGEFGGPAPVVLRLLTRPEQLIHADIEEIVTRRWVRGRVVLLGDAAHAMTPNLGQGAGMAIEDAVVLADLLAAVLARHVVGNGAFDRALNRALQAYLVHRLRRVARIQEAARQLGWIAQWSLGPADVVRSLLLRALPAWIVERRMASLLAGGPAEHVRMSRPAVV